MAVIRRMGILGSTTASATFQPNVGSTSEPTTSLYACPLDCLRASVEIELYIPNSNPANWYLYCVRNGIEIPIWFITRAIDGNQLGNMSVSFSNSSATTFSTTVSVNYQLYPGDYIVARHLSNGLTRAVTVTTYGVEYDRTDETDDNNVPFTYCNPATSIWDYRTYMGNFDLLEITGVIASYNPNGPIANISRYRAANQVNYTPFNPIAGPSRFLFKNRTLDTIQLVGACTIYGFKRKL